MKADQKFNTFEEGNETLFNKRAKMTYNPKSI